MSDKRFVSICPKCNGSNLTLGASPYCKDCDETFTAILRRQVAERDKTIEGLRELLRDGEWAYGDPHDSNGRACPWCYQLEHDGHGRTCPLAAALSPSPTETPK